MANIEKRNFLGVDESNNGGVPPVYVGVSTRLEDVLSPIPPSSEVLGKFNRLRGCELNLIPLIDFRFIIFGSDFCDRFHVKYIQSIALLELLKSYPNTEKIFLDGELRSCDSKRVFNTLKRKKDLRGCNIPMIFPVPHGDQMIPIINVADIIARHIYRQCVDGWYNLARGDYTGTFPNRRIKPNLDYYLSTFKHR